MAVLGQIFQPVKSHFWQNLRLKRKQHKIAQIQQELVAQRNEIALTESSIYQLQLRSPNWGFVSPADAEIIEKNEKFLREARVRRQSLVEALSALMS